MRYKVEEVVLGGEDFSVKGRIRSRVGLVLI